LPPAIPLPAATVLRDAERDGTPEVLLLRRHGRSGVLPDMYVFPGGRVEERDRAREGCFGALGADRVRELAATVAPETAPAYLVAAIRETFEEAGILLARPRGTGELLPPGHAHELSARRLEVQSGALDFLELMQSEGLELAADLFSPHAHWITPEVVPQRFDTLFFAAIAPGDQAAAHDGVESTEHVWIRPEDALAEAGRGERRMIFPTLCNLDSLSGFASAAQALEASRARPVLPILPTVIERDGRRCLVIPPEAGYRTLEDTLEP